MKKLQILALIAMISISNLTHASCDASQSQSGIFPFKDERPVIAALTQLQRAVLESNKPAVAQMVFFPITVRIHGKSRSVNRSRFIANYRSIISPAVRSALNAARFQSQSDFSCVFWNSHGLMLGNGEIWFGATKAGGIKVIAINN